MLVLTSVIVTVAPGTASPASSKTLPRSPPLTACAWSRTGVTRTNTTLTIAAKRRPICILLQGPAEAGHYVQSAIRNPQSHGFPQQLFHAGHALPRRFLR